MIQSENYDIFLCLADTKATYNLGSKNTDKINTINYSEGRREGDRFHLGVTKLTAALVRIA